MVSINTNRIRLEMARQELTLTELSNTAGISRGNLSTMIRRGTCNFANAGKIAKALGLDPGEIMQ